MTRDWSLSYRYLLMKQVPGTCFMLRYANVSPIVFMEKGSPFVPMATFNYDGKIKKVGKA